MFNQQNQLTRSSLWHSVASDLIMTMTLLKV